MADQAVDVDQAADAELEDSSVDAGGCAAGCVASAPCMPSNCNPTTGMCEVSAVADGSPCGEDETDTFICVAAHCVMRGCGDGYREPGSGLWPREGCDDGNQADGDTCSATCEPIELVAQVDPGGEEFDITLAAYGRSLALDGFGHGLLVWVQHHYAFGEARQELRASRIDPYGNFLDVEAPLRLDTSTLTGFDMTPSAVGLSSGGFVVAWTAQRSSEFVVLMRRIAPDGTVANAQNVHPAMTGAQRWPQLAALTDSFVVVWQTDSVNADVWGRRFRNTGAALSTVTALASTTTGRQQRPSVAAHGDEWMVAFLSQTGTITSPMQIRARRFLNSGPLGSEFGVIADSATSHSLTALGDDYLLAYTSRANDQAGDLYTLMVPRASGALGTPLPLDTDPTVGAAHPQVAPYGPRELGAYVVSYNDNAVATRPLFLTVGLTPPSEVDTLRLLERGEDWPAVAAAPYELTGGSVWFGYTAQVRASSVGAVVFQLPPP